MDSNQFEHEVRTLLELQGWYVTDERLVGHKKIDAYAEKLDAFGSLQRIAIECKHWDRLLSQKDVTEIYINYFPLIDANLIDDVILITKNGLSASASTYVAQAKHLRHLKLTQLITTIINFNAHLKSVLAAYLNNQIYRNYIPQGFGDDSESQLDVQGISLEDYILSWAADEDFRPIAVLGGYGFGKTTLTTRLAYLLAQKCSTDPTARMPIILSLSSIATDQTLEGLLGRQFTSVTNCPNYSYNLFLNLNQRGKFIIFLDGFDEMKKTMSWDSLIFNLGQLHQLVAGKSKVVLLGRPSTFLSDAEHAEALHGMRATIGAPRRVPGWPDYRELHLLPFSKPQIASFIQNHLRSLPHNTADEDIQRHKISKYLDDIESREGRKLMELAKRPVQLHMLMQILPGYTGELDRLTVAVLYSEFIDFLLRRESEKPSRMSFSREERRAFASRLAYWMWQDNQRRSVDANSIPDILFGVRAGKLAPGVHLSDIKRDLLTGGFLDRKSPNLYYFPHRSFQEYLVADDIAHRALRDDSSINDLPFITPEITSFVIEMVGQTGIGKVRRKWASSRELGGNLRDLINTGCALFNLPLIERTSTSAWREDSIQMTERERAALLRKLDLVGVISTKKTGRGVIRVKASTTNQSNLHRKRGVTRKRDFSKA